MMKNILKCLIVGFVLVSCSAGVDENFQLKTDPDRYDQEKYPVHTNRVREIAQRIGIPGLQIVHLKNDDVNSYVYGYTNNMDMDFVDEKSLFQGASLSKTVATYLFLKLYDKGVFELDKPLHEYYEYDRVENANNPKNRLITARHVLAHLTGFPNWIGSVHSEAWYNSTVEVAEGLTPGEDYSYSGEGFNYLQVVIEHLTGKSLQTLAEEEVFRPFDMESTSFEWKDNFTGRETYGHREDNSPYGLSMVNYSSKRANSAYTILTTALDFSKFVKKALMEGEGLQAETFKLLSTTASYPEGQDSPVTRGLGLVIQKNEKGIALFHSGSNTGFRAYCIAYPELDEALVILTNGENGSGSHKDFFPLFLGDDQEFYVAK